MTERDYIIATSLANVRTLRTALQQFTMMALCLETTGVLTVEESMQAHRMVGRWEEKIADLVKIR